ncbi:MAG: Helix-turn-helix domain [Pseudomonadota bacterium]|jgi:transcriptional regulator with XRE-family HTH domain
MFRLSSGLTQEDLAREFGLSIQQMDRFEGGFARIQALHLVQIARLLNVPVTAFFDEAPPDAQISSRQLSMLSSFNALPDPQQVALLNLTEAMAAARPPRPVSGTPTARPDRRGG